MTNVYAKDKDDYLKDAIIPSEYFPSTNNFIKDVKDDYKKKQIDFYIENHLIYTLGLYSKLELKNVHRMSFNGMEGMLHGCISIEDKNEHSNFFLREVTFSNLKEYFVETILLNTPIPGIFVSNKELISQYNNKNNNKNKIKNDHALWEFDISVLHFKKGAVMTLATALHLGIEEIASNFMRQHNYENIYVVLFY